MEFISNFWPAYVPIGIVLVAAIIELVIDAGKRERSRPSLDQLESVPGNVIILDHGGARFSSPPRRGALPVGAAPPARDEVTQLAGQRIPTRSAQSRRAS
jgi:hypothetical protein